MIKFVTHVHVDLDNVISTCCHLIKENIPLDSIEKHIKFVPASTRVVDKDEIPVDIMANKHPDSLSYVSSYFSEYLPYKIVREIKEQDSVGYSQSRCPLQFVLVGLKENDFSDLEIIQHFYPIVEGWIKLRQNQEPARKIFNELNKTEINGYHFIISELKDMPRYINVLANKRGYVGLIYNDGINMGITRFPGHDMPDLSKLKLQGWFAHSKGFLFCWGSHKSPKKTPPPQFKRTIEFIEFLRNEL